MSDRRSAELGGLLDTQPGLRWLPLIDESYHVAGLYSFTASHPSRGKVEDTFEVRITLLPEYPQSFPIVTETGGRIPREFHSHPTNGSLCLASPARLRLISLAAKNLVHFLDESLVPYLYSFTCHERFGTVPFGELSHGELGILEDFASLFGVRSTSAALHMLQLATAKKRVAMKCPCPCGSGRKFGACHHRPVYSCRDRLGQRWLRQHLDQVVAALKAAIA